LLTFLIYTTPTGRVAIFRQKNYSTEYARRTDGSSIRIPPVSQKRKTSEFRSEPFLGREKPLEFRSEPFLDEKNIGIPFQIIFEREKTRNSIPNHFQKK
jgi:hypothetical protein